jgi:uncharacterized protein YjbI with pentapeptide repeats
MRYLTLLALALLLCSSGAFCQTNSTSSADINASALRALVIDSSAKLESYSFSMEMAQNIDLVNLSSMESQRLYTRSIGLGLANMTDRALKLVMASLTYAQGDEENSSAVALEQYLLNDTIYIKLDGNWTVLKMPGAAAAWSQSTLEQQVNMFNQSNLILIGTETVEGQDCYKVKAKIDARNTTDLFSNTTQDVYYWITKDTHLLKKTDVHQVLNVTPQSLGLPAAIGQKVRLDSTTSMLFGGFNESVNIMLPSDAGKAQQFPQGLAASNEAVPVASNESESIQNAARLNEPAPITSKVIESKSRLSESISKLSGSTANAAESNESMLNAVRSNESIPNAAKSNEPIPSTTTTKLNESKSRLSESVSRLNKSMPDAARLNELKLRLNATMPNAALPSAKMSNATLSNATLSNATLSNATLSNATLSNATLSNATLSNATLSNATFSNATLSNATLSNATLSNATLSNATSLNATSLNATSLNATSLNATMQENRTIQAASTPWRIFL